MVKNFETKNRIYTREAILATISAIVFLVACYFGEGLGGSWGSNIACPKYLGCTSGFFGYDAIEHFLFGIAGVFLFVWLCKKFQQFSFLQDKRWKNFLLLVAMVTFLSVLWEFGECARDAFRLNILHEPLRNIRLQINLLDQPTNIDTMGDLFFGMLGSIVALFFYKVK